MKSKSNLQLSTPFLDTIRSNYLKNPVFYFKADLPLDSYISRSVISDSLFTKYRNEQWVYGIVTEVLLQPYLLNIIPNISSDYFFDTPTEPSQKYVIKRKNIQGVSLDTAIWKMNEYTAIQELGTLISQVHSIPTKKFGHLDVVALGEGRIEGLWESWEQFLLRGMENHLDFLQQHSIVTARESSHIYTLVQQKLQPVPGMKKVLLHGDIAHHNVLISKDRGINLVDWEDSISGDPFYDIAYYATGCFGNEQWFKSFLKGYGKEKWTQEEWLRFYVYYLRIAVVKAVSRIRTEKEGKQLPNLRERILYAHSKVLGDGQNKKMIYAK